MASSWEQLSRSADPRGGTQLHLNKASLAPALALPGTLLTAAAGWALGPVGGGPPLETPVWGGAGGGESCVLLLDILWL